jgi:galactose-1-phosphate uridylyltransferase
MSDPLLFADTPINRVSMKDMTIDQIEALVETFQERRMRSQKAYAEALVIAEQKKHDKDSGQLVKRLEQMQKVMVSVDNGLEKLRKYTTEVRVLRMALED